MAIEILMGSYHCTRCWEYFGDLKQSAAQQIVDVVNHIMVNCATKKEKKARK